MPHNTTLGRAGEQRAVQHLESRGFCVVDRNWRCTEGEIDIVAIAEGILAIVEVKTRTSTRYGHPLEALDEAKVSRLWRIGFAWARAHVDVARGRDLRVDAISVCGPDPATADLEHLAGLR
ncbi:YraN family protein [Microbacterium sp. G2-8]|uniref:YraN family protein n=1 Tax=Microbacterium sp. G2-8 TaxID=2842454 RepID=UPI001C89B653|nr:YraN family protein [Microbacterium sp. G2-8]